MTKSVRKKFFYSLSVVFVLLGAGAVLYAQGWRVDLARFEVGKVGAIYVHTSPHDAEVLFEGELLRKNVGVFDRGVIIGNLFPRQYTLTARKDGYHTWQMSLPVKPSRITQAEHVVLVPRVHSQVEEGPVEQFWLIAHTPLVRLRGESLVFRGSTLSGDTVIDWMEDGSGILTEDTARGRYFWHDLRSDTVTNITSYLPQSDFSLAVTPSRPEVIVHTSQSILRIFPEAPRSSSLATRGAPRALGVSEEWVAWSEYEKDTDTSLVTFYNSEQDATSTPVSFPSRTERITFTNEERAAVLQENGALYLIDAGATETQSIADGVELFAVSSDGSRIAAVGPEDIEIVSLSPSYKDTRIRIPNIRALERLAWYKDTTHLFLFYGDRIAFLDLLDRELQNLITIAATGEGHYDEEENTLYLLENGTLSKLEFPE